MRTNPQNRFKELVRQDGSILDSLPFTAQQLDHINGMTTKAVRVAEDLDYFIVDPKVREGMIADLK